jgi:hypothetical protein
VLFSNPASPAATHRKAPPDSPTVLPGLDETDVAWRFHAMLGVMVYTMANSGRIEKLTDGACDPSDYVAAVDRLVPIVAAMFRSGSTASVPH